MGDTYKHINLDYLNDLALGSNEFKEEMITSFLKTTPENIEKMQGFLDEQDYKMLGSIAHKLKTSYSFMGMDEMVVLSKTMQDNGLSEQNVDLFPAQLQQMKEEFENAKLELQKELDILKNA